MSSVDILSRHIEHGNRECPFGCPVALAILDKFNMPLGNVTVNPYSIWVADQPFRTPDIVADFVRRYDAGEDCRPFSFELPAPLEV